MVWGIMNPGIGEYGPSGEYTGWYESLNRYYEQMPPQEQAIYQTGQGNNDYNYYVSSKFNSVPGSRYRDKTFTPIEPHEVPPVFKSTKGYVSLGSLIMLRNGYWAVDEDLKAIIERLELGIHQFYHIPILMPREKTYPKPYYIVVIGQRIDSFSPEDSEEGSYEVDGTRYNPYFLRNANIPKLALKRAIFGAAQVWKEANLGMPELFFSDMLYAEIKNAGLRLPRHYKMKEV